MDRLSEQGKKTAPEVQELGASGKNGAQEKLGRMQASASEHFEEGRERVEEMGHSIEQSIRANPIKFLLIAAGVGLVFGRFCMGR